MEDSELKKIRISRLSPIEIEVLESDEKRYKRLGYYRETTEERDGEVYLSFYDHTNRPNQLIESYSSFSAKEIGSVTMMAPIDLDKY